MSEFTPTSLWAVIGGITLGLILGAICIDLLRRRGWLPPQLPGIVNYGLGTLIGGFWLGGCVFFLSGGAAGLPPAVPYEVCATSATPSGLGLQAACFTATNTSAVQQSDPNDLGDTTKTPTPTEAKPTATPTPETRRTPTPTRPRATPTPTVTPTATPTATPALPSTFSMALVFSNGTCGDGTFQHPYTFTIDNSTLSLLQVDANITTTGPYDPTTGVFSTSAQVGPGVEAYAGTIALEGNVITVTGQYSYTQEGLCQFMNTIFGQTTGP